MSWITPHFSATGERVVISCFIFQLGSGINMKNIVKQTAAVFSLTFLAFVLLAVGCSDQQPTAADLMDSNIIRVRFMYTTYMNEHGMRGPKDKATLLKYFRSNENLAGVLKHIGANIDDIEDYFYSERDGEEFIVRYGLTGIANHAIVFENTGVDGLRQVGLSPVQELADEEYEGYLSGKIEPQRPGSVVSPDLSD